MCTQKPARVLTLALTILLVTTASRVRAATPAEVDASIKKGVDYLYRTQGPDGTWEGTEPQVPILKQDGGYTSAAVYALLTAGENEHNPKLVKAINYLKKADITGIYAMGFQALALSKLESTPDVKEVVKKDLKRFILGGERDPSTLGLYRYQYTQPAGEWDHSCSQYGALGIWACGEAGMEIPDKIWEEIDAAWRTKPGQDTDGGWGYGGPTESWNKSSIGMTAGGIATLFITDDALSWQKASNCNGNPSDTSIEKGIKWIIPHLEEQHGLYDWYGIERIGIACGYKYLGTFDWYKRGADAIIKMQAGDGSWDYNHFKTVGTAYAVLFLCKGRAPVIMNKLRYDLDGNAADPVDGVWNQRPRDDAGAAKFVGDELEGLMNWQVVTLAVDDADDLHDSSILYLAGPDPLKFSQKQEDKLRQFVEDGGLLLGNADCGAKPFADSFKALCTKLFADKKYDWRKLPPNHPIYNHEQFLYSKWKAKPDVEGLSNGVRELAVLIPEADPAKAWQMQKFKSMRESFELIADIYLYTVDRQNIAEKGSTYIIRPDPSITGRSTIKIARIQYDGNWDPEPGGLRRLSAIMHNDDHVDLKVEPVTLSSGKLGDYKVATLTGTDSIQFNATDRAALKQFVDKGGLLIVDASGGSSAFADAIQAELSATFPDGAKSLVAAASPAHPIYKNMASPEIRYRSIMRTAGRSLHGPNLRIIEQSGKPAVIFSPDDLSAGLVGESVDGVLGYAPQTATDIMASILLYVLNPVVATPQSATQPAATEPAPADAPIQHTGGNPFTH